MTVVDRVRLVPRVAALAAASAGTCACNPETPAAAAETGEGRLFASQRGGLDHVGVYDAGSGQRVGELTGPGLQVPFGVHIAGQTLYIVSQGSHAVYAGSIRPTASADTLQALAMLVTPGSGGLVKPFYTTAKDGRLYVSSHDTDQVLMFDTRTGDPLGIAVAAGAAGLDGPRGLDHGPDGTLYVASSLGDAVLAFDPDGTGRTLATGIATPCGLAVGPDGRICVGSAGDQGVSCYAPSGSRTYEQTEGRVCGITFGRDGRLYVARPDNDTLEMHDLTTGERAKVADVPSIAGVAWAPP
jgi:outer membrane protein assembly factor BamB